MGETGGAPAIMARIREGIAGWIAEAPSDERKDREQRALLAFGRPDEHWNEELALERYELLYEIGLVPVAHPVGHRARRRSWKPRACWPITGAFSPQAFPACVARSNTARWCSSSCRRVSPFCQLQRTVEALAGVELHKPNFRRLVENQGLVEETGTISASIGGRPARFIRFRRDISCVNGPPLAWVCRQPAHDAIPDGPGTRTEIDGTPYTQC